MNVSVYRNGILYSQMCEKSRKVNSGGSSSLPGPTQRSQNWLEKKVWWQASLGRLPEILLGHQEKSHLSLIFLSRADAVLEVVSVLQERPGDTLPICQFLFIIQFSLSVNSSFIPSSLWPWKGQCHLGRGLYQGSSQPSIAPTS